MSGSFAPKVFGIGLSKTGTTSLYAALHQLGYRSATYRHMQRVGMAGWFKGDFSADYLGEWDAVTDLPVGTFFRDLDRHYPGSKFILTCREMESWLASAERQWSGNPEPRGEFKRNVRMATYGMLGFDRDRFRSVYEAHVENVQTHFRDRPADLLVMNLGAGDGWPELCSFVGRTVPNEPFPNVKPGFSPAQNNGTARRVGAAARSASRP